MGRLSWRASGDFPFSEVIDSPFVVHVYPQYSLVLVFRSSSLQTISDVTHQTNSDPPGYHHIYLSDMRSLPRVDSPDQFFSVNE
jgi:hypothetical protein